MKLIKKVLVGVVDLTAALVIAPLAFASCLLTSTEYVEYREWYLARCKGSWKRLWA